VATHNEQEPPEWKKRGAAVELEAGVRELAEKPGERDVGALIVVLRAEDKALASCRELSTATTRWRPSRAPGSGGACKRGQRRGEIGPGQGETDAWRSIKQEVERQRRHSGGGKVPCTSGREQHGRRGGQRKKKGGRGPKDLCAKLKDSRDLSVKQNFPLI
jgi:hypothetical protein